MEVYLLCSKKAAAIKIITIQVDMHVHVPCHPPSIPACPVLAWLVAALSAFVCSNACAQQQKVI